MYWFASTAFWLMKMSHKDTQTNTPVFFVFVCVFVCFFQDKGRRGQFWQSEALSEAENRHWPVSITVLSVRIHSGLEWVLTGEVAHAALCFSLIHLYNLSHQNTPTIVLLGSNRSLVTLKTDFQVTQSDISLVNAVLRTVTRISSNR